VAGRRRSDHAELIVARSRIADLEAETVIHSRR
jgi:hypothetical protein